MGHDNVYLVYMMCQSLFTVQMKPVNKLQASMSNQQLQANSNDWSNEEQLAQNIRPATYGYDECSSLIVFKC